MISILILFWRLKNQDLKCYPALSPLFKIEQGIAALISTRTHLGIEHLSLIQCKIGKNVRSIYLNWVRAA